MTFVIRSHHLLKLIQTHTFNLSLIYQTRKISVTVMAQVNGGDLQQSQKDAMMKLITKNLQVKS